MLGLLCRGGLLTSGPLKAAGIVLLAAIWISAICSFKDMVCLQYSRQQLFNLRNDSNNISCVFTDFRKIGVCKTKTHRGVRGSGHRRPIQSISSSRNELNVRSRGVNYNNLFNITSHAIEPANNNHAVKFGLLNARSVRNKVSEIVDHVIEEELDIAAFTETWLKSDGSDCMVEGDLCPPGFKLVLQSHSSHSNDKKNRKGGVGILFKENIKQKNVERSHSPKSFDYIESILYTHGSPLHLIVIYRFPPNAKNKLTVNQFLDEFSSFLEEKILTTSRLLIVGDFNFHVDNINDKNAEHFLSVLDTFDLQQHVHQSTHARGHTLDLIITRSSDQLVEDLSVTDTAISDHFWATCLLPGQKSKSVKKEISYRKIKAIDIAQFKSDIELSSLSSSFNDVDTAVTTYNTELAKILDKHAPIVRKTVTLHPEAPWFNDEIKNAKKERRKAEHTWRKSNLTVHREIFVEKKTTVNNLIKSAKETYYSDMVSESEQKNLFKIVDKITNKKPTNVLPEHTSAKDLADKFGTFFTQKIEKIRDRLAISTTPDESTQMVNVEDNSTIPPSLDHLEPTTCEEVKKIVMSSKVSSCRLDPIPTQFLKILLDVLLPILTNIINLSFDSGSVPTDLKIALILPLLKKLGLDPEIFKHFRPVSNLSYLSKLMERVAAKRLLGHMSLHHLHEIFQSSYKEFHSTETALLRVHNDIRTALDNKKCVLLILLDLSAAFDTINHSTLLSRLSSVIGISGKALEWFASYLRNRFQSILIDGVESSVWQLLFGVPQGSVLGPILFIIYTSPLGKILRDLGISYHFYADDSQLYISFDISEADTAVQKIEDAIEIIRKWMAENFLCLNDDKTEVLLISSQQNKKLLNIPFIKIGDQLISPTTDARNIGFIFDNLLNCKKHIATTSKSAWFQLRKIGQIRQYLDAKSTEQLVHSFVTSKLDINNALLYGLPDNLLHKLQVIQNAAARLVKKLPKHCHITPILQELHWLPVRRRIDYKILLIVFKALHGLAPQYIREILTKRPEQTRSMRSNDTELLQVPPVGTKCIQYSNKNFIRFAPLLWNSLPLALRKCDKLIPFKRQLKTHLFSEAYS